MSSAGASLLKNLEITHSASIQKCDVFLLCFNIAAVCDILNAGRGWIFKILLLIDLKKILKDGCWMKIQASIYLVIALNVYK